jgi:hypothetical protein
MNPSDFQTDEANKEDTMLAPLQGTLEDAWKFDGGYSIAKNIASFLSMEDLLRLEQTSKTLQEHLTAEDPLDIWTDVLEQTIALGCNGQYPHLCVPRWWVGGRGRKACAVDFLKADAFAKACEQNLQEEMGREVADELFDSNLDEPNQAGYDVFVRATVGVSGDDSRHEQQRQVRVCGFPEHSEKGKSALTFSLGMFPELMELADLLNKENGFIEFVKPVIENPSLPGGENEPKWLVFLRSINLTIVAAHKNRPHRLVRTTRGLPTNMVDSDATIEGVAFFSTESAFSNDDFQHHDVMNVTPDGRYALRCDLALGLFHDLIKDDGCTHMLCVYLDLQDSS